MRRSSAQRRLLAAAVQALLATGVASTASAATSEFKPWVGAAIGYINNLNLNPPGQTQTSDFVARGRGRFPRELPHAARPGRVALSLARPQLPRRERVRRELPQPLGERPGRGGPGSFLRPRRRLLRTGARQPGGLRELRQLLPVGQPARQLGLEREPGPREGFRLRDFYGPVRLRPRVLRRPGAEPTERRLDQPVALRIPGHFRPPRAGHLAHLLPFDPNGIRVVLPLPL